MLSYKVGDLFSAPRGTVLAHACNCKGVWGAGIASQFRLLFPKAYREYQFACNNHHNFPLGELLGTTMMIKTPNYTIGCLMTSEGYGSQKDPECKVLESTNSAVELLLVNMCAEGLNEVHSPRINSGLFGVPWEKTEKIIVNQLEKFPSIDWTVWSLKTQ